MERAKRTIVVSAVNIRKGGTLTILRGCLEYLSSLPCEEYRVVALVHKRSLADFRNIEYIEIPTTVKSWFRRLWCEYVTMYGISKKLQPVDLWLSLHDTTPRVVAKRQAVYCQTSFPFLKVKIEDLRFDPKIVLFSLFTRFAYQFESVEETPAAAFTGDDDYPGTELQNGLKNTWEIINTKTTKTWTDYVNIAQNGFTGATPPTSANIMTATGANPMFECLSRNRDLNGDGKIDEDEVRWYLPSVRQCIFAWCGKKSLPTEISFETTNYATSTNLGFRIWWALEGTAISSWANMETNPMIRCVRNLGTNSTSGEVSDITSWDQENYVVTVNGLKDETLRTNMQIGEYPEHENFDAASTLPKAFKIASADLNIPASGEDTYAPEITVGELNPTGIPESESNTTSHNITVPITITNYDESKNYTYQIGADNEVNVPSAKFNVRVTINLSSTNDATASTTIKIKSDNGNYTSFNVTVTLTTRTEGIFIFQTKYYTYTYSKSTPQQTIVAGGTPAKNTFKYTEIMNGDWCEKYYQEGTDDLGKWRIPNEKELYFIPMYCGEEITGNLAGYKPSGAQTETGTMRYAAKTKYNRNLIHDPSNPGNTFMIYHLQKDGSSGTPIVTTGHNQSGADFTIRCVRDAPQGTRSYDSSYSSGGKGFGL